MSDSGTITLADGAVLTLVEGVKLPLMFGDRGLPVNVHNRIERPVCVEIRLGDHLVRMNIEVVTPKGDSTAAFTGVIGQDETEIEGMLLENDESWFWLRS